MINMRAEDNEVFFIAQKKDSVHEDLRVEEKAIIEKLDIKFVYFDSKGEDNGIYRFQRDAIAVARMLQDAKPSRKLAVIAARRETPVPHVPVPPGIIKP